MARHPPRVLWRSCHPGPVVAVTSASALYARSLRCSAPATLGVAGAVLAGQLAIGWQNDALDAARDEASGRSDKPAALGEIAPGALARSAALAGAACVPLSLLSGRRAGAAHLLAVGSAASYNLGLKATSWSVAPFVVSFGLLPAFVSLASPGRRRAPWWAVSAGALLGAGAHVANALPDLAEDEANGVVGLPHRLGRSRSLALMGACLLAATAALALGGPGPGWRRAGAGAASSVLAGAALAAGRQRGASRRAFDLVLGIAVLDVALLLAESRAAER